jgi:hypothetical protein
MFPAKRPVAYSYFSDMHRLVDHLKHIDLVSCEQDSAGAFRLYYHTVELGTYHIHVYCDARLELSSNRHIMRIVPCQNLPPIETRVGLNSTATRGFYSSEAHFHDAGDQTCIEYKLKMEARAPRPKGLRFMPGRMVNGIAHSITTHRMQEIAENFVESSLAAFPEWLAQNDPPSTSQTSMGSLSLPSGAVS